jgi:ATP-dependent protease Clp ATPase subunit
LIAGPKVFICDVCVGVCGKILEAMPAAFAGWEAMTNEQLLESPNPSAATVEAVRAVLQAQVDVLGRRSETRLEFSDRRPGSAFLKSGNA